MRVLLINTSEQTGGAAVAAGRLLYALIDHGVKAKMLVRDKTSDSVAVTALPHSALSWARFAWERGVIWLNNRCSRQNLFKVSMANTGFDVTQLREFKEADIIHLHWVNQGMLSLHNLQQIFRSGKPVVWTMHDMWPCTGICHHAYECRRYEEACGMCPFLRHAAPKDLSHRVFEHKARIWQTAPLHLVAVSRWLADKAEQSALTADLPVEVIANAAPVGEFAMRPREQMREQLEIGERYVLIFGAARLDDSIKGFDLLCEALHVLTEQGPLQAKDIRLLTFGDIRRAELLDALPVAHTHFGRVTDRAILSTLYSAADVVVNASKYETFGQTLVEGQLCGCLPVSFGNSGQADIVQSGVNGVLVDEHTPQALARGLAMALTQRNSMLPGEELRLQAARRYSPGIIAGKYANLYQQILQYKWNHAEG